MKYVTDGERRIKELEARCRQMDAVVRTVASLDLGPKGYCSGNLLKLKECAVAALASETGTKSAPQWNVCPHCRTEWIVSDGAMLPCPNVNCTASNRSVKP